MDLGQREMNSKPRLMIIIICFEFLVAPSPLGMGLSLLLLQTFITKVMTPPLQWVLWCTAQSPHFGTHVPVSSAARSAAGAWLTAKGSHLAWGQDPLWGQLHPIPGGGGLWRRGHLVSRGDNSEGPPNSRASYKIGWGLSSDCVVAQLFPLPRPLPSFSPRCWSQEHP